MSFCLHKSFQERMNFDYVFLPNRFQERMQFVIFFSNSFLERMHFVVAFLLNCFQERITYAVAFSQQFPIQTKMLIPSMLSREEVSFNIQIHFICLTELKTRCFSPFLK